MSRLLLDYDGEVEVSEEGGSSTASRRCGRRWTRRPPSGRSRSGPASSSLVPLTGNELGTNLIIAGLNGFNLLMSWYALSNDLTFEKISWLIQMPQLQRPARPLPPLPPGTAVALGVVPLVFSPPSSPSRWSRRSAP